MLILHLAQNIALLISLSFLHGLFMRRYNMRPGLQAVMSGILFGCVALIGMMLPVRWESGIIFDGRSIVLSIAGLFGGPVSASIAALMAAIYRLWLGGAGAVMGVSVIIESAMLGSIVYYLRRKYPDILTIVNLYLFGLTVHVIMVILMFTLPQANTSLALQNVALPVLLVYPPAVVLVALLFIQNESIIKSEQRLRDSELKNRLFFEQAAVGIAEVAPDGRILNPNNHFCEIVGYSRDQLQKLNFRDITNPEDLHLDEKYIAEVMDGQRDSFDIEKRYIHKDGQSVWIHLYSNVIRDKNGNPLYVIASIVDITNRKLIEEDLQANYKATRNLLEDLNREIEERKQAEEALNESLAKYKTLIQTSPMGITVSDKDGKIVECNEIAERLLGLSVDEHKKRSIDSQKWQIIRKDGSPMPAEEFASVRALKENRLIENIEMGIVKDNNRITWINVSAIPIPLESLGVLITYHDITKRVKSEVELREKMDETQRFNKVMVGREHRMIELKQEINDLCKQMGLPPKYRKGRSES